MFAVAFLFMWQLHVELFTEKFHFTKSATHSFLSGCRRHPTRQQRCQYGAYATKAKYPGNSVLTQICICVLFKSRCTGSIHDSKNYTRHYCHLEPESSHVKLGPFLKYVRRIEAKPLRDCGSRVQSRLPNASQACHLLG